MARREEEEGVGGGDGPDITAPRYATFKSNVIGCNGVGSLSNALKGLMRVIGQGLEINFIGIASNFSV